MEEPIHSALLCMFVHTHFRRVVTNMHANTMATCLAMKLAVDMMIQSLMKCLAWRMEMLCAAMVLLICTVATPLEEAANNDVPKQ